MREVRAAENSTPRMVHRREQILGFMREFGISSVDSRARSLRLREVARIAKVFEIKRRA